jgi:hypothetical protein
MTAAPATPELDRRSKILGESHKIGEFLDWLNQRGIHLATYEEWDEYRDPMLTPLTVSYERLLADYFEIDLQRVEAERRAILEHLRRTS